MIFLNEYDHFRFTKITVPIALKPCPTDIEEFKYFVDIDCDDYYQENCYIGSYRVENIHIHRIGKRNKGVFEAPKWQITIVINETLKE